ncbi:MAG: hypothetical protein ACI381_00450 [Candidatus Methanomethylophilaceae archaeon]
MDGRTNAQVQTTGEDVHVRSYTANSSTSGPMYMGYISGVFTVNSSTSTVYCGYGFGINSPDYAKTETLVSESDAISLMYQNQVFLYPYDGVMWTDYVAGSYPLLLKWYRTYGTNNTTSQYQRTAFNSKEVYSGISYIMDVDENGYKMESKYHIDNAGVGNFYFKSSSITIDYDQLIYADYDFDDGEYSNVIFHRLDGSVVDMAEMVSKGLYGSSSTSLYYVPGVSRIQFSDPTKAWDISNVAVKYTNGTSDATYVLSGLKGNSPPLSSITVEGKYSVTYNAPILPPASSLSVVGTYVQSSYAEFEAVVTLYDLNGEEVASKTVTVTAA